METIFSPSFHIAKHAGGEIANGGSVIRIDSLIYKNVTMFLLNTCYGYLRIYYCACLCFHHIINFHFFPHLLVDFVKYFRSGDRNQDHEIEYSHVDVLNVHHIGKETSESIVGKENNYTENTVTSITFPVDMELDTKNSSENLNSQSLGGQMHSICRNDVDSCCNMELEEAHLSSEVSAIYLAMKNSKLECVDEHGQDSMSTDVYVEDDQYEEFDEFDPYFFIKNLPDLSSVVPTFRPMLLPKQTRSCPPTTLVLDLDGKKMQIVIYNLSVSLFIFQ